MTKYICSLILSIIVAFFTATATTVHSTAGQLSSQISDAAAVTELTIDGTVNAADLFFIGSELTSLHSLDLSAATIVAYSGRRLGNLTAYPAGAVPASCMAASPVETVVLPAAGALSIGAGAFAGAGLTAIVLGENIEAVGDGAFAACPALASASIEGSPALGTGVFSGCQALKSVTFQAEISLPAHTFANCSALADVNGSQFVTEIGDGAFSDCHALTAFKAGSNLQSVGSDAFRGTSLKVIDLSSTRVSELGSWAFADNPELTTAHIDDITTLSEGVFFNCPALATLTIGGVLEAIPAYAYTKSAEVPVSQAVPENVRTIGAYALSGNNAPSMTLPQSLDSIGDHGMERMNNLTELAIYTNTVPALGQNVWDGINASDVTLNVLTGMQPEFMAADQWRNFHIIGVSDSSDAVSSSAAATQVSANLADGTLTVRSAGAEIAYIHICDPKGVLLKSLAPHSTEATAFVGDLTSKILLVTAGLSDGTLVALKMAH